MQAVVQYFCVYSYGVLADDEQEKRWDISG